MSTVLVDDNGNYIMSNSAYKGSNLFKYLMTYNDLNSEEKESIMNEVENTYNGYFTYNNSNNEKCVFSYMKLENMDKYCVSAVPVSSFHNVNYDYRFTLIAIVTLFIVFAIDISWLNYMNIRLKISADKEKSANEAKSELLSRMSHDIRTPMNAILGLSNLGSDETKDEAAKEYFDIISSSGSYLLGLINDILDMNRIETGRVEFHEEIVEVKAFFDELIEMVAPLPTDY